MCVNVCAYVRVCVCVYVCVDVSRKIPIIRFFADDDDDDDDEEVDMNDRFAFCRF